MIGCFAGIAVLSLSRSGVVGNPTEVIKAEQENTVTDIQFNTGIMSISLTAILYSTVAVFTRKMKGIHFTIIQFHYGWVSFLLLVITTITEYLIFHNDPDFYGATTFRLLTYNGY